MDVVIDMASVESGAQDRDDHLRSGDFFDVANYPDAMFRSTAVTWSGTDAKVAGELTIVGVTKPVSLDVAFLGAVVDLNGKATACRVLGGHRDQPRGFRA